MMKNNVATAQTAAMIAPVLLTARGPSRSTIQASKTTSSHHRPNYVSGSFNCFARLAFLTLLATR